MIPHQSNPIPEDTRILMVDDDPGILTLCKVLIARLGPTPETVETGKRAMTLLNRDPFDLLILDLMLPDVEDFEILEAVRDDPRFDPMPVLIVSARADDGSITQALELGADGYVTKPFLSHTLTDYVSKLVLGGRPVH